MVAEASLSVQIRALLVTIDFTFSGGGLKLSTRVGWLGVAAK